MKNLFLKNQQWIKPIFGSEKIRNLRRWLSMFTFFALESESVEKYEVKGMQ